MMKKLLILLVLLQVSVLSNGQKILLVSSLPDNKETKAAMNFLQEDLKKDAQLISFGDLKKKNALKDVSTIWIHENEIKNADEIKAIAGNLKTWINGGGKILLTLQSFRYVNILCGETQIPRDSIKAVNDDGYGRRLGLHAFLDHPVFKNLNGGAYLQRPVKDTSLLICGFFGNVIPKGKVIATDWDYIFLREDSKLMVEYAIGKGKVIAIGAYMNLSIPNYNYKHLALFTRNVFDYLACDTCNAQHYWSYEKSAVSECSDVYLPDVLVAKPPESRKWISEEDHVTLSRRFASDNFWDVAGERILTMGTEKGGIEEVWSHPFMAFRDYEAGIRFSYKDSIYYLKDERPEIEVHPGYFVRTYKFNRAYLKEIVVNDPEAPAGVVHYEYNGVYDADLVITFRSNLRLMWPYPETATGSICYFWNPDLNGWFIKNAGGNSAVMLGANREAISHEAYQSGSEVSEVTAKLQYHLKMSDVMDVVYTCGVEGEDHFGNFRNLIADPELVFNRAKDHSASLLKNNLIITTPDENFNKGYRWAMLATDRFMVNTPGMGKSLVAGYATTRHGWDGGQKINGRPGYGWYFGRDGEWSGFALLDYGDFKNVRDELAFYQKYQDLNGKIFHEATTSGVIHYDAADATPLYIVLWGKYFRHTGDTAFLRESWPNIKKALDFCFSTDTDNDHLIENTNVGHGWVEGGELYGSHATIYMAGCWAAALNEAYNMSKALGQPDADSYQLEARMMTEAINGRFWSSENNFFGYGINRDGKLRTEPTILPAVPMYFKKLNNAQASFVLAQYASNAFTTNWGTRILREDSRLFKPSGYHYGSVWPLFTGWASLAEFAYGNNVQGFSHLMNNLNIYKNWGLGFAEEVLNGAVYEPSGVCSHQCWSETMVMQPAIEGMLGFNPDAAKNMLYLSPRLPAEWDSLRAENLKMGDKKITFRMERKAGKYIYSFSEKENHPVMISFVPVLPAGTKVLSASINGIPLQISTVTAPSGISLISSFTLSGNSVVEFQTSEGISVLPLIEDPKPGDPAEGCRIINCGLKKNLYSIELEAPAGTSAVVSVYSAMTAPFDITGGKVISKEGNILKIKVDFEKNGEKYTRKTIQLTFK